MGHPRLTEYIGGVDWYMWSCNNENTIYCCANNIIVQRSCCAGGNFTLSAPTKLYQVYSTTTITYPGATSSTNTTSVVSTTPTTSFTTVPASASHISTPHSLSAGAAAGIAVGIAFPVFAAITAITWFLWKRRKSRTQPVNFESNQKHASTDGHKSDGQEIHEMTASSTANRISELEASQPVVEME
jgi:hypothetical protein